MTAVSTPITGPLSNSDQQTTGKYLQQVLVDLIQLHLLAKQAHWTVVGRFFRDVHLHLDELVATARSYADQVAERAATLGIPPDGRARTVAETSGLADLQARWTTDREAIEIVVSALGTAIGHARDAIDPLEKADLVSQDLIIEITSELEKAHWMWQAQLAAT